MQGRSGACDAGVAANGMGIRSNHQFKRLQQIQLRRWRVAPLHVLSNSIRLKDAVIDAWHAKQFGGYSYSQRRAARLVIYHGMTTRCARNACCRECKIAPFWLAKAAFPPGATAAICRIILTTSGRALMWIPRRAKRVIHCRQVGLMA